MENLEANSESTQPQTQNAEGINNIGYLGTKNTVDPGPRKPGKPGRSVIEALKRLWDRIFNRLIRKEEMYMVKGFQ
ncbi:hypothetical protein CK516_00865 [Nostoc sp. 'Peltigera malacea cyanobiont' DB3992]|nr:hypothetical protein CK516_00865 [Nostoc sp. 'Peltigera malacea cyanobiont' DB3992]